MNATATRIVDTIIASTKPVLVRHTLISNRWKVLEGVWSIAEWKRHAKDYAYGQGPFRKNRYYHRGEGDDWIMSQWRVIAGKRFWATYR